MYYRVLVRVEKVDSHPYPSLLAVVPGWNHRIQLRIDLDSLPVGMQDLFLLEAKEFPVRVHARMNLAEQNPEKLVFRDWESE